MSSPKVIVSGETPVREPRGYFSSMTVPAAVSTVRSSLPPASTGAATSIAIRSGPTPTACRASTVHMRTVSSVRSCPRPAARCSARRWATSDHTPGQSGLEAG